MDTQLHHPGETRTRDQELSGGTEHRGTPIDSSGILELDDDERRELNLKVVSKYRYQFFDIDFLPFKLNWTGLTNLTVHLAELR